MRVICIKDSLWCDGPYQGQPCTRKGSIYHVTASIDAEEIRATRGILAAPGAWYQFLEVSGTHHHIRFLELPDDEVEEEVKELRIKYQIINELNL